MCCPSIENPLSTEKGVINLPGCLTFGETEQEAIESAKEALALHMYGIEQDGEEIPTPTSIFEVKEKQILKKEKQRS